ncbi:unnamed protein product, partial [Vitis vinifera]
MPMFLGIRKEYEYAVDLVQMMASRAGVGSQLS